MPNMNRATDILRVKQIAIDEDGNVTKRFPRIDAEGQLKNTLLFAMHPEICVLSMQVPGGILDAYEQARISQVLMRVRHEGREYCLIGASGSAKDGKFYAVDAQHEKLIADRFQKWPQAAITYFGILVSDCKVVIQGTGRQHAGSRGSRIGNQRLPGMDLGETVPQTQLAGPALLPIPPRFRPDPGKRILQSHARRCCRSFEGRHHPS